MASNAAGQGGSGRTLRADARRNRERLVAAATELFTEEGVDVPLEAIARRADVGIGTLYRRFPDRESLAEAVALEAFATVREVARAAIESDPGSAAFRRFVLEIAEQRVGVLLMGLRPILVELPPGGPVDRAFEEVLAALGDVVGHAQEAGELRHDVTAEDVLLLLALLTQRLESVPGEYLTGMTPRLLHLVLEGIQPVDAPTPPPPAPPWPTIEELRATS